MGLLSSGALATEKGDSGVSASEKGELTGSGGVAWGMPLLQTCSEIGAGG
jgi:hypothetical protein